MFGGILREFWEILGKYRMLDLDPVGSKWLNEKSETHLPAFISSVPVLKISLIFIEYQARCVSRTKC